MKGFFFFSSNQNKYDTVLPLAMQHIFLSFQRNGETNILKFENNRRQRWTFNKKIVIRVRIRGVNTVRIKPFFVVSLFFFVFSFSISYFLITSVTIIHLDRSFCSLRLVWRFWLPRFSKDVISWKLKMHYFFFCFINQILLHIL